MLRATLHEQEIRHAIGLPGEGDRSIVGVGVFGEGEDHCLYFVNTSVNAAMRESLASLRGCIVIAPEGEQAEEWGDCIVLESKNPRAAIARVLDFIRAHGRHEPVVTARAIASSAVISPLAVVEGAVEIGEGVVIEPFCVIGPDVRIGRGSIVRSGVRLFPRVSIGDESVIGVNTVIGHQGYGFVRDEAGNKVRIAHLGGVSIGSHVEIDSLVIVQSGTIMPTVIEDHAKLGDLTFVGHNVHIARGVSVAGAVAIGGSAAIGAETWVGINSTIRDGRRVGSHALIGMDASVQHDLADDSIARAPRPAIGVRSDGDHSAIGFKKR